MIFWFFLSVQQNMEQLYRPQLLQLQDMGFVNSQQNLQAIMAANGDVNGAIDRLQRTRAPAPAPASNSSNSNSSSRTDSSSSSSSSSNGGPPPPKSDGSGNSDGGKK